MTEKPKLKPKAPAPADQPASASEAVIHALQQLADGTAGEHAQKLALAWIINAASNAYGPCYRSTDRDTAFMAGRAFVGQQIVGLLKINLLAFAEPAFTDPSTN